MKTRRDEFDGGRFVGILLRKRHGKLVGQALVDLRVHMRWVGCRHYCEGAQATDTDVGNGPCRRFPRWWPPSQKCYRRSGMRTHRLLAASSTPAAPASICGGECRSSNGDGSQSAPAPFCHATQETYLFVTAADPILYTQRATLTTHSSLPARAFAHTPLHPRQLCMCPQVPLRYLWFRLP